MFPVVAEVSNDLWWDPIVSYLGPRDVISLTTCRRALENVEAFSRRELDRIEREHDVDDTWRFRIAMQAAEDAAVGLSREGEDIREGVLVPDNISYRRLLRSAYRTHLYTLGGTMPSRERGGYTALAMHPDGNQLLSGGYDDSGHVRLWDVSSKQFVTSFIGHERAVYGVCFSSGHIVSSSDDDMLRIWDMDGPCKKIVNPFQRNHFAPLPQALAVSNDVIYTVDSEGPIFVIDTLTGEVTSMEQPWDDDAIDDVGLCVCKNYLLHSRKSFWIGLPDFVEDFDDYVSLYVFDRDTLEVQSQQVGELLYSMACTSDGAVATATVDGEIKVSQLMDGGTLVARHLVTQRIHRQNPSFSKNVLHITETKLYVKEIYEEEIQSTISVYDITTGTLERRLCNPRGDIPRAVTSNDRELFVGTYRDRRQSDRLGGTIKAFLS